MEWKELIQIVADGGPCNASALSDVVTGDQITELLSAAPCEGDHLRVLRDADFSGVKFVGKVNFWKVQFAGNASFAHANFDGNTHFNVIESNHRCSFKGATFCSNLYVGAWEGRAWIDFESSTFMGLTHLSDVEAGGLVFTGSNFKGKSIFSDLKISGIFSLAHVTFSERVRDFIAGCRVFTLWKSRLDRGGIFYFHGGTVELSDVELGSSTMIAGTRKSGQFHNADKSLVVDGGDWRPRIKSVEETDVDKLVLQDVNLAQCRFRGAINLEKLQMEGLCIFDQPPKGVHVGADPLFIWLWTSRMTIFEERIWRSHSRKARKWRPQPAKGEPGKPLIIGFRADPFQTFGPQKKERQAEAEQLAKTYRALRKGREDKKNEPGAADFYYGEMEMRRAGNATPGERFILWLYWLISGYGLRPLRTILVIGVLVALASYLLKLYGFVSPSSYSRAFLASLAAAVNLEYIKSEEFRLTGQWIRIILRIVGPTLFGVLVLAFWGRVKR